MILYLFNILILKSLYFFLFKTFCVRYVRIYGCFLENWSVFYFFSTQFVLKK